MQEVVLVQEVVLAQVVVQPGQAWSLQGLGWVLEQEQEQAVPVTRVAQRAVG